MMQVWFRIAVHELVAGLKRRKLRAEDCRVANRHAVELNGYPS